MSPSAFDEVKIRVTPTEAARFYGFEPSRSGFISCPFHGGDRTPSLKLYSDSWHCFGCGAGGSVIDFVCKLFDLSPMDAICKINTDFNLGLPLGKSPTRAERTEARKRRQIANVHADFEGWREAMSSLLTDAYRIGWQALRELPETLWLPGEVLSIRTLSTLEYWIDLLGGDLEQQMQIFKARKRVEKTCTEILKGMPERFKED